MASPECDKCGLCCTKMIIEIDHVDVVREPKLLESVVLLNGMGSIEFDSEFDKQYSLAGGCSRPCPHLGDGNLCGIYPTRPNVCVQFEAGSNQCQQLRRAYGLPPLPCTKTTHSWTEIPNAKGPSHVCENCGCLGMFCSICLGTGDDLDSDDDDCRTCRGNCAFPLDFDEGEK